LRLFSFGGYGLALVVFGAYDSYPNKTIFFFPQDFFLETSFFFSKKNFLLQETKFCSEKKKCFVTKKNSPSENILVGVLKRQN